MSQYTDDIIKAQNIIEQVNRIIFGKEKEILEIMLAFLANGHILLEDIPGVGKTTIALAFSKAMGLEYRRVQFTPDVMPSDLTGFSIYRKEEERFVYQKGSIFCNLLLADEINRTSPKTQSALLEVMEEKRVTVEGVSREVPKPFLVIATQNPFGSAGTQPLPEAQVDRFMIQMSIGYPDFESELMMAKSIGGVDRMEDVQPVMNSAWFEQMQKEVQEIYIKEEVYRYLVELVTATRKHPYLVQGGSPRATIALVKMARAAAWMQGRNFVTPVDVASQFPYVIVHRIVCSTAARMEKVSKEQIIKEIIEQTKKPPLWEKMK